MDTLSNIWAQCATKPFLVYDQNNRYVLVQTQAQDNWFIGKPMSPYGTGFQMDGTSLALRGDESIWTLL